ncbi:MAG: rod shape-determining protein MreD [Burkholderiales bacterium]
MSFYPQPQRILLPAKVSYIALSLLLALVLELMPWRAIVWLPDWVALVLAFWCIHQPRRIGIGIAWTMGLLVDAGNGSLLGQHALGYAVLAFAAIGLHRRIQWFSLWQQAAHVLLLLLASRLIMLATGMIAGGSFPGVAYFAGSLVAAALWPVVSFLLLLPQRRPERVDENRPI